MDDDFLNDDDDSWPQSLGSGSGPDLHVASTPIMMVSPPETADDDDGDEVRSNSNRASQQDVFQTPPEDSNLPTSEGKTPLPAVDRSDTDSDDDDRLFEDLEPFEGVDDGLGIIVAVGVALTDANGSDVVGLGRTTDLGFPEVEETEFRVSKRGLSQRNGESESPMKKLKCPEVDLGTSESPGKELKGSEIDLGISKSPNKELEGSEVDLGTSESPVKKLKGSEIDLGISESPIKELEASGVELGISESPMKKLKDPEVELGISEPQEVAPLNVGCSSGESLEMDSGGDEKSAEEGSAERNVEPSDNDSETAVEETEFESEDEGGKESIEDVMARIPNVSIDELRRLEGHRQWRALPPSISGPDAKDGTEESTILDVLELLKDKYHGNGNNNNVEVDSCSFLEISRRRGMTFPRPSWWPEGGF